MIRLKVVVGQRIGAAVCARSRGRVRFGADYNGYRRLAGAIGALYRNRHRQCDESGTRVFRAPGEVLFLLPGDDQVRWA